ncbi:hypothetical protein VPFG_00215 [Vibrio phage nt-1]|uniref:Uncharacterized protein n=1 Tax=Vibrio phage nt-1 TaxID=115992 RepID=R9TIK7_9CAUD|nr:hypothetical protein VPFG_00215 [Vibrio phage nt-1]AGN30215.1 hypothetical protein VPFG_00215 [Vibrio phage nt-1]
MNSAAIMQGYTEIKEALICMLDDMFDGMGHIDHLEYFEDEQMWDIQYYDGNELHEVSVTTIALDHWMDKNK